MLEKGLISQDITADGNKYILVVLDYLMGRGVSYEGYASQAEIFVKEFISTLGVSIIPMRKGILNVSCFSRCVDCLEYRRPEPQFLTKQ